MVLLAHAGHWAIWVLYSVPVVIVLASIVISLVRDRGHGGPRTPIHSGELTISTACRTESSARRAVSLEPRS